ncbi:cation channel sperm-associated auxiliary subunit epsilon isoform X2 [Hemicordylus capensis]|uniref:cation channel sperm-associated auxiliary subunit epsilon isoform X2 n=1 Tax=Hemicordylus capensis TaxID=884348 RepID=UPI002303FF5D|nr:cation channel sperm-associated auxiliary subunit epsilon isoform X2 [Hemicordylus capensis]
MARFVFRLGDIGLVLLYLWLSGCWALWRYTTNSGNYRIFSTRTTIHLEYEGTQFQEWDIGSFCTAVDKNAPKTTIHCTIPGTHTIKPVVTNPTFEDNERYLSIISDVNCFLWYIHQKTSTVQETYVELQDIKAWVFDPENADDSELKNTATSPPEYSETLSKQFLNLGQRPVIVTFLRKIRYHEKSYEAGVWTLSVPTVSDDIVASIYGRAFTFQDCFVLDTPFTIAQLKFSFTSEPSDFSITLPAGSSAIVRWAACVPTAAVLLTDFGTFHTTDGFITSQEIKFPQEILDIALSNMVKAVSVVFREAYLLIGDMVYKISEYDISSLEEDEELPDSGIIGIRSRTWCASAYPVDEHALSELLIWTENEIYQGFSGDEYKLLENTANLKRHLKLRENIDLKIVAACYDSLSSTILTLLECTRCTTTPVLYLAAYDEERQLWFLRDLSLPPPINVQIEVVYSAATSMVIWGDDKIYYSYKGNKVNGYLKVSNTKEFSAASEGSTIHQIIMDYGGNAIIKMKNNVLYFLKIEMTDTVKLAAWESERTPCIFYFNPSGGMYLLTFKGTTIHRQTYPLKLEVYSTIYSSQDEVCPYISFQYSMDFDHYYLDKGQNITFWTQIVFRENEGLSTDIEINRPELLKEKTYTHYEIARGICTKNLTMTFYHDQDYSEVENYTEEMLKSSGVMTVELQPSSTGKTCISKSRIAHIRVGCYPSRSLVIESTRPTTCEHFNFTIPKQSTWHEEKDVVVDYDMSYGCPIEVHYALPFRPLLALYIDKMRISTVEANYVLWEVNGRKDFSYNTTMEDVHCSHKAQNWTGLLRNLDMTYRTAVKLSDERFLSIWGPHNYKSCFTTEDEDIRDLKHPYEIMNSSGINSIIWPQYYTGIYMFKLRVLDPNFSFCDIVVKFAVRTFGVTERTSFLRIAGWSVLLVTFILGWLVCSYFRYTKIFQKLSYVDPLQSFQGVHGPLSSSEAAH